MSSAAAVIVGTIATEDDDDDDDDDDNTVNDGRLRRLGDWLGWPSAAYIVWAIMRRLAPIVGLVFSLFEHPAYDIVHTYLPWRVRT